MKAFICDAKEWYAILFANIAELELRKLTTTYGGEHVEQRHPRVQLVNVASKFNGLHRKWRALRESNPSLQRERLSS
jgi:hypothetical protein